MLNFDSNSFYMTTDGFVLHDGIVYEVVGFDKPVINLRMIRNPKRTAVFMVKDDFERAKQHLEQFVATTREQEILKQNSYGFGVNVDDFIYMQNRKNG